MNVVVRDLVATRVRIGPRVDCSGVVSFTHKCLNFVELNDVSLPPQLMT
jgi:hypothetical protein